MSKLDGINTDMSGKIGKYVYRRTKHGTVVAQAPRRYEVPRRSEKQMYLRCQMGNAAAFFRLFDDLLLEGFEGKPEGTNEFNMFVKANYGKNPVFITQDMRMDGACVVAPYTFTHGSLVCVGYNLNTGGVLVSNLSLGTLVIGAGTTVADLAMAVLRNNAGWQDQDQLTFFYARQWFDASGTPRASMLSWKVVLDVSDESPLLSVVNPMGFTSVAANGGYVLGMSGVLESAGAAWVHSRTKADGSTRVGTQKMLVVSDILEDYQTAAAMKAAANSYGGFNSKAVYLNPKAAFDYSQLALGSGGSQSGTGSNGGGAGTGSSSGTGGSGSGTSGTGTGGGSETPTVAAPTINGTTPFEETTTVTMSGPAGATIHYTTDGSAPTASSTQYSEALTLSDTTTIKAIAVSGGQSSAVTTRTFTKGTGGGSENPETE